MTRLLFLLCWLPTLLLAQDDDFCYIKLNLKAASDDIAYARYYDYARSNIKVELMKYEFSLGKDEFGKTYTAEYMPDEAVWMVRVPKGYYLLRTQHIGFSSINRDIAAEKMRDSIVLPLEVPNLSYTYDKGGVTYDYIKGALQFSETITVHFKSGDPSENMAFLMDNFPVQDIKKISYINSFLMTLNLKNTIPLAEVMLRQTLGDQPKEEGYYFGDSITQVIKLLMNHPNVNYATPNFIVDETNTVLLSKKDFSSVGSMMSDFQGQSPEAPKVLNTKDFEESDGLQQKRLKWLREGFPGDNFPDPIQTDDSN